MWPIYIIFIILVGLQKRARKKGVYIISTQEPEKIIYVGKTRGPTMYFAKRLRRHAQKGASGNSKVYKKLKEISDQDRPLKVTLIDIEKVKRTFRNGKCGLYRRSDDRYIRTGSDSLSLS